MTNFSSPDPNPCRCRSSGPFRLGVRYNNIPTFEEQAKAKWAYVQNNYQRRADLILISLPQCKATPSRKRTC